MKKINVKRAILENGNLRKEVKFGFSWGAFFLGFIYPLIKEDYMVAGISFVVISIASMIFFPLIFVLSMVFGFLYNKMYVKKLIKQGWHPFTEEDAQILRMNGILFDDKNNSSKNNREGMAKEIEYYDMQPSEKTEVKNETQVAAPAVAKVAEKPAATPAVATVAPAVTSKAKAPVAAATTQASSSNKGAAIYQAALAQLGRYQDCTMLVTNALKAVGINFHDWPAGYMSLGTVVPASQAQPGDLVYYANGGMGAAHIGVYAGNGQAIHGGWNGNQTVLNTANLGSGPVYIRVK